MKKYLLLFLLFFAFKLYAFTDKATIRWIDAPPVISNNTNREGLYNLYEKNLERVKEALYNTNRFVFVDTASDYLFQTKGVGKFLNIEVFNVQTGVLVRIYNFVFDNNYTIDNAVSAITTDFAQKREKVLKVYADRIIIARGRNKFYAGEIFQLSVVKDEIDIGNNAVKTLYKIQGVYSVENIEPDFLVLKPLWQGEYKAKANDFVKVR